MTSIMSISIVTTTGAGLSIGAAQDILEQAEDAMALRGLGEQMGVACAITQR